MTVVEPENSAILLRPVTVLARRIAVITASVPVLLKVTRSIPASSQIDSAISPASSDCGPSYAFLQLLFQGCFDKKDYDQRFKPHHQVYIFVAIDIPYPGPKERLPTMG